MRPVWFCATDGTRAACRRLREARHGDSGQLNQSAPKVSLTTHEAWFRDKGTYVSINEEGLSSARGCDWRQGMCPVGHPGILWSLSVLVLAAVAWESGPGWAGGHAVTK